MHAETFWLVWSPQGRNPPTYRHPNRSSALREAARLAERNRGTQFYVLEAKHLAILPDGPALIDLTPHPHADAPF